MNLSKNTNNDQITIGSLVHPTWWDQSEIDRAYLVVISIKGDEVDTDFIGGSRREHWMHFNVKNLRFHPKDKINQFNQLVDEYYRDNS